MALRATVKKHVLQFKFEAGTSRGVLKEKNTWFIKIWNDEDDSIFGLGEAGPLVKLSIDDVPDFEAQLQDYCSQLEGKAVPQSEAAMYSLLDGMIDSAYPAIYFGMETALLDLMNGGERVIFKNDFQQNGKGIPINGLVWMGHMEDMLLQVSDKVTEGYDCIKIKIGSLNFERECDILQYIRNKYYKSPITLRVDANGAFSPEEAMGKLAMLSKFNLHSIEQPIKPGQSQMTNLCATTPVPIALDEELIGVKTKEEKQTLLESIKPQFIILKPTLVGGIRSCKEWISMAEQLNIGWWMTSALESNVGLNAIAQFTAEYCPAMHQGLGTGKLYENNIPSPLEIKQGSIYYNSSLLWDLEFAI